MQQLFEIIKISRPGFWPTHLWFFVLPFARLDMLDSVNFWVGCVYVCFPLSLLLYGWNDIGDAKTDESNPRKNTWLFGARPSRHTRKNLPWIITIAQLPFVIAFWYLAGYKMLIVITGIVIANYLYNNLNFKAMAGLDLLNQTGYLLIFVLASWLCNVPQLNWAAMIFGALFAMHSHLFGQLMDVDQDKQSGRKSTAITIGVQNSKFMLATIMLTEAVIAFRFFTGAYVGYFLIAGAIFFACDALAGPKNYPIWFVRCFFIGWNLIVIFTIHFIWKYGLFLLTS